MPVTIPMSRTPRSSRSSRRKPELVVGLFKRLMVERLQSWIALADERLAGTGIKCYVSPGNDDFFEIDEVLAPGSTCPTPKGRWSR